MAGTNVETNVLKLELLNSFGANFVQTETNRYVTRSLLFLENYAEPNIVYPVGRHIGIKNLITQQMRFIKQGEQIEQILGLHMITTSNNKTFLVVTEKRWHDFCVYLNFYDLTLTSSKKDTSKPYKTLNLTDLAFAGQNRKEGQHHENKSPKKNKDKDDNDQSKDQTNKLLTMSFNNDGKQIAFVIKDNYETKAVVYEWLTKNKIYATFDFSGQNITRISFAPKDSTHLCTSGPYHWRAWRITENSFKMIHQFQRIKQDRVFTDHCWLDDKLIVGTQQGELIVLDNYDEKQRIDNAFNTGQVYGNAADENLKFPLCVSLIRSYSKGFFIASDNGYMGLWVRSEENNSTSGKQVFDFIRRWQPGAAKNQKILSLDCSNDEEYIGISLENNNIGIIETKSIGLNEDLTKEIRFDLVSKGFHSGKICSLDIATQRPLIITCSKEDSTIRLWNYKTFTCEMAREYYVLEDMSVREAARPLISVAIHPSGYYMAASFIDKVRLYHILHDEFKHYQDINIQFCKVMKFSQGGNLFACVDGRNIVFYDSYTLERVNSIPLNLKNHEGEQPTEITQLIFNENDASIAVAGTNGYIGRWWLKLSQSQTQAKVDMLISENQDDISFSYQSLDYIHIDPNEKDQNMLAMAGSRKGENITDELISQIPYNKPDMDKLKTVRVMNSIPNEVKKEQQQHVLTKDYVKDDYYSQGHNISEIQALGSFTKIKWVNLHPKSQGMVVTTDSGNVAILSLNTIQKRIVEQYISHYGKINHMALSPDHRKLFTAGEDGVLFVFDLQEQIYIEKDNMLLKSIQFGDSNKPNEKKDKMKDERQKIVVDDLADIVLVKRDEMIQWKARQKQLKYDLALTKKKVEMKLIECKRRFDKQYQEIEKQKDLDIKDLRKRYNDLEHQKNFQDKQNAEAKNKMEMTHLRAVEQTQSIYEKRIFDQGSDYLTLEQSKLEMQKAYEAKIEEIKKQNNESIEKLLKEFRLNLNKVQLEYEESKRTSKDLKKEYDEKLKGLEVEHDYEIENAKTIHFEKKIALDKQWGDLEIEATKAKQLKKDEERKQEDALQKLRIAKREKKDAKRQLQEKVKQISLLKEERQDNIDKLTKREHDLYRYKFKIKDLQKSKHVLTHRTTEMRASLQPKEKQIETQKEKLHELEEQFEKVMDEINKLNNQDIKALAKYNQFSQDLLKQKDETQEKKKIILKFAQDVYKIVQTKDDKEYKQGLMQLNQNYVMSEAAYIESGKKKDLEHIDFLDKKLKKEEQATTKLMMTAIKQEQKDKDEIMLKRQQNQDLLDELNTIKKDEKLFACEIKKQDYEIEKLSRDNQVQKKQFKQDLEDAKNEAAMMLQTHGIGINVDAESHQLDEQKHKSIKKDLSSDSQQDNIFNKKKENLEDKARILELVNQLDNNNQQIFIHKLEIRSLKDQVIKLLEERQYNRSSQQMMQQQQPGILDASLQLPNYQDPRQPQIDPSLSLPTGGATRSSAGIDQIMHQQMGQPGMGQFNQQDQMILGAPDQSEEFKNQRIQMIDHQNQQFGADDMENDVVQHHESNRNEGGMDDEML